MKECLLERGKIWATKTKQFDNKLKPFDGDKWGCPWLEFWANKNKGVPAKGIFLMQDWGDKDQRIEDATMEIEDWSSNCSYADKSLDNLKTWSRSFNEGRWLITNAVWGLRNTQKKSGYLGNKIHKCAYTDIWKPLVEWASEDNPEFILIVAGSWARFDDLAEDGPLQDYFDRWDKFVGVPQTSKTKIAGRVRYCPHPSTWKMVNFMSGPPCLL